MIPLNKIRENVRPSNAPSSGTICKHLKSGKRFRLTTKLIRERRVEEEVKMRKFIDVPAKGKVKFASLNGGMVKHLIYFSLGYGGKKDKENLILTK